MTKAPSLFAVVLRHLGTSKAYAVRALTPAAATSAVLDQGGADVFTSIEVTRLEELETAPADLDHLGEA